jgi:hypothetical protein
MQKFPTILVSITGNITLLHSDGKIIKEFQSKVVLYHPDGSIIDSPINSQTDFKKDSKNDSLYIPYGNTKESTSHNPITKEFYYDDNDTQNYFGGRRAAADCLHHIH